MIRVDFAKVEVNGLRPVVMAELSLLLKCLRVSLGEEAYNRVLQYVNESKTAVDDSEDSNSEDKDTDFEPHLSLQRQEGESVNFGRIGEKTNIRDIAGRALNVGDTVNLYCIKDNGRLDFHEEKPIAKDDDSEFVMGIKGVSLTDGVSFDADWVIVLNRRHTEVKDGEIVGSIKYIKSERIGE